MRRPSGQRPRPRAKKSRSKPRLVHCLVLLGTVGTLTITLSTMKGVTCIPFKRKRRNILPTPISAFLNSFLLSLLTYHVRAFGPILFKLSVGIFPPAFCLSDVSRGGQVFRKTAVLKRLRWWVRYDVQWEWTTYDIISNVWFCGRDKRDKRCSSAVCARQD